MFLHDLNIKGAVSDSESSENIVSENNQRLGWKPVWNNEKFLQNIDAEIQDVLEFGKAKSSLIDSLFEHARWLDTASRVEQF